MKIGVFNNKQVKFNPGVVYVCVKMGMSIVDGMNLLAEFNLKASNIYDPKIMEVLIPRQDTLKIASMLSDSKLFRFVDIDRQEL